MDVFVVDLHLLQHVLVVDTDDADIAAAGLLAWTTAAMEFAIANLLLAGSLELLQPLINGLRGANGHLAAALAASAATPTGTTAGAGAAR